MLEPEANLYTPQDSAQAEMPHGRRFHRVFAEESLLKTASVPTLVLSQLGWEAGMQGGGEAERRSCERQRGGRRGSQEDRKTGSEAEMP